MIILDKPYISENVIQTIIRNRFPVLKNGTSEALFKGNYSELVEESDAIKIFKKNPGIRICTISENSISWIIKNLGVSELTKKIKLFKNKTKFRTLIRSLYPDFFYKEVTFYDLKSIDPELLPMPIVVKPSVGFFSIGVKIINSIEDWEISINAINSEMKDPDGIYPPEVLDIKKFIIEEYIRGEEFAIDAYFDNEGIPVILGIMHHAFSSDSDAGDRLYMTSPEIIRNNIDEFTVFLENIGNLAKLKNFPLHIEIRKDKSGIIIPIEINPLRFGAWCTTADATTFAYNMNPYEYFFSNKKPDWDNLLKEREGKIFSLIVLDNTTGKITEEIKHFDYERILDRFGKVLELRKIDYKKYNVFGFVFTETDSNDTSELDDILYSDLKEYIS